MKELLGEFQIEKTPNFKLGKKSKSRKKCTQNVVEGVLQETGGGFHEISKNFTANMAK
jgi:hypothetical protein